VSRRRKWVSILAVSALAACLASGILEAGGQDAPKAPGQTAIKAPTAKAEAAPRPPRERMAVSVLLAWTWLSIAVLFWLVRLRVREADRIYRLGLPGPVPKKPHEAGR
jgi:hypothetical protein